MSKITEPGWIITATQSSPLFGHKMLYAISRSDRAGAIAGLTEVDLKSLRDGIDSYLRASGHSS